MKLHSPALVTFLVASVTIAMAVNILGRLEATYVSPDNAELNHTLNPKCIVIDRNFERHINNESFVRYIERTYDKKNVTYEWAKNPRLGLWGEHIIFAYIWLED